MILHSLKLENIRSYTNEKINFPEGAVLLSGDIGSGKSTILLAVEFALFGIMRSGLTGTALLRHGTKKGAVELKFEVDNKEYIIKRTLKRTKTSVGQDNGHIITDGKKLEATPVELKAKIIALLGYPEELISRSKSFIYRFTVYTAQEQMKEIIFEDKDIRLDTLRKVFGIDKYKSIKENAVIFIREIKRRISELNVKLENYDDILDEKKKFTERKREAEEMISKKDNELQDIKTQAEKEDKKLKKQEQEIREYNELKKDNEIKKTLAQTKKLSLETLDKKIKKTEEKIVRLDKNLEKYSGITYLRPEKELEETLSRLQDKHSEIVRKKASAKEKMELYGEQIKELERELKKLSSGSERSIVIKKDIEDLHKKIRRKPEQERILRDLIEKDKKAHVAMQRYDTKIKDSQEILRQIETAETCPTCRRELDENHRKEVVAKEEESIKQNKEKKEKISAMIEKISSNIEKSQNNIRKISEMESKRNSLKEELVRLETSSSHMIDKQKELSRLYERKRKISEKGVEDEDELKQKLEKLKKELSQARDNNLKYREKKNLLELSREETGNLNRLKDEAEKTRKELEENNKEIENIRKKLEGFTDISDIYEKQKHWLEEIKEKQKQAEIKLASLNQERKYLGENINSINKKLEHINKIKEKIKQISQIQEWFESFLLRLMSNMEKHIMVSIHREFNSLVKEWFSVLIDDIDIDLDEEFSVRMTQDGYETSVEGLSGGEKTSVALAYRLALNKVINDLIPKINTKNLIILDEPTDGFSTEQLDRVRDVLRALDMKQTIIVSHEPKMESYVQHIIRITKVDNVSRVIS